MCGYSAAFAAYLAGRADYTAIAYLENDTHPEVYIRADRDYPPFTRSTMDGYAVRSSDTPGTLEVIEEIPSWAKAGRDVLGDAGDTLSLMRAVKARFDPKGTLNPGRFVGGL